MIVSLWFANWISPTHKLESTVGDLGHNTRLDKSNQPSRARRTFLVRRIRKLALGSHRSLIDVTQQADERVLSTAPVGESLASCVVTRRAHHPAAWMRSRPTQVEAIDWC